LEIFQSKWYKLTTIVFLFDKTSINIPLKIRQNNAINQYFVFVMKTKLWQHFLCYSWHGHQQIQLQQICKKKDEHSGSGHLAGTSTCQTAFIMFNLKTHLHSELCMNCSKIHRPRTYFKFKKIKKKFYAFCTPVFRPYILSDKNIRPLPRYLIISVHWHVWLQVALLSECRAAHNTVAFIHIIKFCQPYWCRVPKQNQKWFVK
jgi:hypothetical protein